MLSYDARTALLVVDLQNDFAEPAGSLTVSGGLDVVPVVNAELQAARAAGALVVYTQDWHPPSTPHFAKDGGAWPVHCVIDTWGARFVDGLVVDGPVVRKGTDGADGYSGFSVRDPASGNESAAELDEVLRTAGGGRGGGRRRGAGGGGGTPAPPAATTPPPPPPPPPGGGGGLCGPPPGSRGR